MSLAKRVRHLEERWAYYFAFGTFAFICRYLIFSCFSTRSTFIGTLHVGSGLANAALFALLFPAVCLTYPVLLHLDVNLFCSI